MEDYQHVRQVVDVRVEGGYVQWVVVVHLFGSLYLTAHTLLDSVGKQELLLELGVEDLAGVESVEYYVLREVL